MNALSNTGFTRSLYGLAWLLSALGFGCSSSGGASPAGEPLGDFHEAIKGGSVDEEHSNVFLLYANHERYGSLCTATLLAPNLLLTARHCVSAKLDDEQVHCGDASLGETIDPGALFALNDTRPDDASRAYSVTKVRVPSESADTCGYDLALVTLKRNVAASVAVPAIPRIDREVMPGEVYTAVGYGVDENGDARGARYSRVGLRVACQPGRCGNGVESTEFLGEDGICSGDSGGPALDADGKVVGVVSRGGPDCTTPIYGTVTGWKDLIISEAQAAAVAGGYDPPFWVTSGVSDPPVTEGDAGGAAGAANEAPQPMAAEEGETCSRSRACAEGLACYASAAEQDATCQATCSRSADCNAGQSCEQVGTLSLCMDARGASADESCALSARGLAAGSKPGAFALCLGIGATWLRRRQRRLA